MNTDAELMERWRRGDLAAFEALAARWRQPMARFLFRLTGRADRVGDLVQEVFVRLYTAGPRYRENGAFAAWLYRIALNIGRDALRRVRREPLPLDGPGPPDTAVSAERSCERRELAGVVARAVAELPEPQRVVLALRHDEGLSFEEIARLTGVPATTWKSRFAAALLRLRERLRALGYGPEELHA
jgi:RNA polymerase sigma-70 factor, ECF subfamily